MTLTHDPDCARARKSLQALAGGPGPVLGTKHPPPPPLAPSCSPLVGSPRGGCGISLSVAISYASMLSLLHTWSFFVVANVVSFEKPAAPAWAPVVCGGVVRSASGSGFRHTPLVAAKYNRRNRTVGISRCRTALPLTSPPRSQRRPTPPRLPASTNHPQRQQAWPLPPYHANRWP